MFFKTPPGPRPTQDYRVEIENERTAYQFHHLFRIVEAQLRYRLADGRMSQSMTRVNFERGDAVGVLLYDPRQDAVILVRQFRYPVYAGLSPEARAGDGARQAWVLEVVAGIAEDDQTAPEVAQRELLEEAGYVLAGELTSIATIYASPGGSSERIHLYLGQVDATQRVQTGGGLAEEGEDTQVLVLPFQDAMERVARGEIQDGKTILCLQYLALHKETF